MKARSLAITLGATVVACALGGCPDKKDANTSTTALTDQDTPVAADYADEAASQIDKDNYKSELDKMAAEIEKE